ncbi:molybdopterin-dependent oxidoreductase [Mycolicibacterium poriferae]|uniref:molybdopterin-dependent oxidoreductase n=1 Tax=Mycolicibacterium poriferae TaxID=39694 RepID=UPI0024B99373|nr:molybdopterin-dependent oxidoreductase [Mycolicibacterium poriferae]
MWDKRSDMIFHGEEPLNAEAPRHVLAADHVTPVDAFYSRNHGPVPAIAADDWRLHVGGRVAQPHVFTLDEIRRRFATHAVTATLQCAALQGKLAHRVTHTDTVLVLALVTAVAAVPIC